MGALGRYLRRFTETDEQRLAEDARDWASKVPGAIPIAETPSRTRVKTAGIVRKITVWPAEGDEAEYLDALIFDGTGELMVTWTGRMSIPGLSLGTKLAVEGVIRDEPAYRNMINPKWEFVR